MREHTRYPLQGKLQREPSTARAGSLRRSQDQPQGAAGPQKALRGHQSLSRKCDGDEDDGGHGRKGLGSALGERET